MCWAAPGDWQDWAPTELKLTQDALPTRRGGGWARLMGLHGADVVTLVLCGPGLRRRPREGGSSSPDLQQIPRGTTASGGPSARPRPEDRPVWSSGDTPCWSRPSPDLTRLRGVSRKRGSCPGLGALGGAPSLAHYAREMGKEGLSLGRGTCAPGTAPRSLPIGLCPPLLGLFGASCFSVLPCSCWVAWSL